MIIILSTAAITILCISICEYSNNDTKRIKKIKGKIEGELK